MTSGLSTTQRFFHFHIARDDSAPDPPLAELVEVDLPVVVSIHFRERRSDLRPSEPTPSASSSAENSFRSMPAFRAPSYRSERARSALFSMESDVQAAPKKRACQSQPRIFMS